MQKRKIEARRLGTVPYTHALQLQKELHAQIVDGTHISTLLLLEHPPVITLGKHADKSDVLASPADLGAAGIDLQEIDRGGEATAHEPGQLVVYPILNLKLYNLGAKQFVNALEDVVIQVLAELNLTAHRDEQFPGVWVGKEKVCSIGIRISRGVSYHGLALNVENSLDTFKKIIPCGIRDRNLRTLSDLLGRRLSTSETAERFLKIFCKKFDVESIFFKD